MGKNSKKPEFRDVLFDEGVIPVHATHWRLYQTCDEYAPLEASLWGEGGLVNGLNWRYRFEMHREGERTVYLNFYAFGGYCMWVSLSVEDSTTRTLPMEGVNIFELARRVRDKVSEVYRHMALHSAPGTADYTWVVSNIENDDGLGKYRSFVYEKYFNLEPLDPEYQEGERTVYFFVPKSECGENGLFASQKKEAA